MYYSIWLFTATLAAGGTADGQPCTTCQTCQTCQQQQVTNNDQGVIAQSPPPQKTGLFPALRARLENMRHHDTVQPAPAQQVKYAQPVGQQPMMMQPAVQVFYAQPMPVGPQAVRTGEPPQIIQASAQKAAVPEVDKQFRNKIGAADDYSWITGQLFYVHADGGTWVLRYGAVDMEDKYGGSVVLAPAVEMKNYREGDLVSVSGEILSDARASRHLGGPLYRTDTISMMERSDNK